MPKPLFTSAAAFLYDTGFAGVITPEIENVSVSSRGIADAGMHEVHHAVQRGDRHRSGSLIRTPERLALPRHVRPPEKCATGKALGDQASTVVSSCGPPYLFGFTATVLKVAELYEITFIELAPGAFTIK